MPRLYTYTFPLTQETFTFRGANRGETLEILRTVTDQSDAEDQLVAHCVTGITSPQVAGGKIDPGHYNWSNALAGLATQLADRIRSISGLTPESMQTLRQESHDWLKSPPGNSEMLMMGLFGYTLETIHSMDPIDWYRAAAAATTLFDLQNKPPAPQSAPSPNGPPTATVPNWRRGQKETINERAPISFQRGPERPS